MKIAFMLVFRVAVKFAEAVSFRMPKKSIVHMPFIISIAYEEIH